MKNFKRLVSLTLCAAAIITLRVSVCASSVSDWTDRWDDAVSDESVVTIAPGADGGEMRFCWLSPLSEKQKFIYGKSEDLSDGLYAEISRVPTLTAQFSNRVALKELDENTKYFYKVNSRETHSFTTGSSDMLTALFVTDSQIGRSGDYRLDEVLIHDTAGWDTALMSALSIRPDISLILSAGDQVEIGASEKQYRAFLAPDSLRSLPIATTVGNHEFYFPYLTWHFNNPNRHNGALLNLLSDKGYYFLNGGVLFVVIDSNNPLAIDHEALIEKAVKSHPSARWRVVMMHHSVYSCENGDKAPALRQKLAPLFDKYNISLVLSGHSHKYSRSYPMHNFNIAQSGGTVYLEGGCCSGSNPKASPEALPSYSQAGHPAAEPVYSVISFSDEEIKIETYAVRDGGETLVDSGNVSCFERDDSSARMSGVAAAIYKAISKLLEIKRSIFDILR